MTFKLLYWSCLSIACGHAFLLGGRPERLIAWTLILGTIASLLALPPLGARQGVFFWRMMLVDLVVLTAMLAGALRWDRFWPMFVAAFQLAGVGTELVILLDRHLVSRAIEDLLAFWTYPMLASLLLGSIFHRRRILRHAIHHPASPV